MNNFYPLLELLYKFNKKYPELTFGCLMHNLAVKGENLFYMPDSEIIKRIKVVLEEEDSCTHEITHMGTCAGCGEYINE